MNVYDKIKVTIEINENNSNNEIYNNQISKMTQTTPRTKSNRII